MSTLADRIKTLRIQRGLTQEQLGTMVGVQKAAINKYETGRVINLKQAMILKIADALQTSPEYIMGYTSISHVGFFISNDVHTYDILFSDISVSFRFDGIECSFEDLFSKLDLEGKISLLNELVDHYSRDTTEKEVAAHENI